MKQSKVPFGKVIVEKTDTVYFMEQRSTFFLMAFDEKQKTSVFMHLSQWDGSQNLVDDFVSTAKKENFSLAKAIVKMIGPQAQQASITARLKIKGMAQVKYVPAESIGKDVYFYPATGRLRVSDPEVKKVLPVVEAVAKPAATAPSKSPILNRKIRILIIDDSTTIHQLLSKIFEQSPDLEVVGMVSDPFKAEQAIKEHKPDVMTVDIHMPGMDGVTLLKRLLPTYPIPAVLVSSISMEEGSHVLNGLEAGAVDHIQKPTFEGLVKFAPEIIEKIKTAATIKVRTKRAPTIRLTGGMNTSFLVGIGSSTGGTEALKEVLTQLPAEIPPILIVQHIPPVFSTAFAKRLNELCPFEVREAEEGDVVVPGKVYLAPGGRHMAIARQGLQLRIKILDTDPVNRHRPSVDVLFNSIAKEVGKKTIGIILTGMGNDGAKGLLAMRQAGARTVAQDEASSCVYGMPKVAAELGGAEMIKPLDEMAGTMMSLLSKVAKAS